MSQGRISRYLTFLAAVAGVTVVMVLVGYWPTRSLGGEPAVVAMWFACGVSLVASAMSGLPIVWARQSGLPAFKLLVASIVLRLLTVAAVGVAVAFVAGPEWKPYLVWLAISYSVLLAVDSTYAAMTMRRL